METQKTDTTSEFIWMEDGNGMKIKHINFDNPNICPRHGLVEIEALKKSDSERTLSNNASYASFTDRKTGIVWGKPTGIHNIGKYIQYRKVKLGNNTFFDRTVPEQAEMCCIVLKAIELGKFKDPSGRPRFKVRDKEIQAQADIDLRSWKRKALDIIESIPYGDELKDIARNMSLNPDVYSPIVLANELCNIIEGKEKPSRAKEFLDMYNSPTRSYLTILKNAQSMGVIEFNPLEGFKYGGMNLGKTQELAISHLVKNPDLAASIAAFTKDKRERGTEANVYVKAATPQVDPEKEELKNRLKELEALLKAQVQNSKPVTNVLPDVTVTVSGDMDALRKEAKELGVSGWQVAKISYEKLKAKVDAKKAEAETV